MFKQLNLGRQQQGQHTEEKMKRKAHATTTPWARAVAFKPALLALPLM